MEKLVKVKVLNNFQIPNSRHYTQGQHPEIPEKYVKDLEKQGKIEVLTPEVKKAEKKAEKDK